MLDYIIYLLFFVGILWIAFGYRFKHGNKLTDIPGPQPANKIEGNFPDIAHCGGLYQFLFEIHHKYGSIASFWWGPKRIVSIASPKFFKQLAKLGDKPEEIFGIFRPLLGAESISFANGEDGRRRNKSYAACFMPGNLQQYYSTLYELVDEMVDKWRSLPGDEHIPLRENLMKFTVKASLQNLHGSYFKDDNNVNSIWQSSEYCWNETQKQLRGDYAAEDSSRIRAFHQNRENIRQIAKSAWRHRLDTQLQNEKYLLIDAILEQDMTEEIKLADMINSIFTSAHTTGITATWTLYFLASHPEVQEKAHKEVTKILGKDKMEPDSYKQLEYLHQVIQETLRWTHISPFLMRVNDTDKEIGGYKIPAGIPVVYALGVIFSDPTIFPEPKKFDPERFNAENSKKLPAFAFEPFGFAGKRKCPGYRFSECVVTMVLAELLKAFRISLVEGQVVTPVYGLVTEPNKEIWVTIEPRA